MANHDYARRRILIRELEKKHPRLAARALAACRAVDTTEQRRKYHGHTDETDEAVRVALAERKAAMTALTAASEGATVKPNTSTRGLGRSHG